MIKILTVLLISLSPSTANAQTAPTCTPECIQGAMESVNACVKFAQMFKPGSNEYNSAWYACMTKLQRSEKFKQCQLVCEPKESNEPTGTR